MVVLKNVPGNDPGKKMEIKDMTISQLHDLIKASQDQISALEAAGNGFDREYSLSGKKAHHPATYKQYTYADGLAAKTNSKIETTGSQIIKRMEMDDMSEAIDLMREGKRVRIY